MRQRLLDELKAMREPADPEAIAKLPYLSTVVNEVLRIHPVAMLMFPRRIESAISLGGVSFDPGDVVLSCIQALHRCRSGHLRAGTHFGGRVAGSSVQAHHNQ